MPNVKSQRTPIKVTVIQKKKKKRKETGNPPLPPKNLLSGVSNLLSPTPPSTLLGDSDRDTGLLCMIDDDDELASTPVAEADL